MSVQTRYSKDGVKEIGIDFKKFFYNPADARVPVLNALIPILLEVMTQLSRKRKDGSTQCF